MVLMVPLFLCLNQREIQMIPWYVARHSEKLPIFSSLHKNLTSDVFDIELDDDTEANKFLYHRILLYDDIRYVGFYTSIFHDSSTYRLLQDQHTCGTMAGLQHGVGDFVSPLDQHFRYWLRVSIYRMSDVHSICFEIWAKTCLYHQYNNRMDHSHLASST